MKRLILLLLTGVLALSLAGCVRQNADTAAPSPSATPEGVSASAVGVQDTAAPVSPPAPTPAPPTAAPAPENTPAVPPEATPTPTPTPEPTPTPTEMTFERDPFDRFTVTMSAFTTTDLDGNTVSSDIFSEKDLTVLHVWGTYCPPCINEMPEISAWVKEFPENVQLIGIAWDVPPGDPESESHKLAVSTLAEVEADFLCLTTNAELEWILRDLYSVPTTIFVDSSGNTVGSTISDVHMDLCRAQLEELLAEISG